MAVMAHDDDDEEIKPITEILVKKGESIQWRDQTDVLENLRTNLELYLNDIAKRSFRYVTPSHKKNAEKMLAKIQELSQLNPADPDYILAYGGLVEIVKGIDIRAKDSFLKRLLEEAKEGLDAKTLDLTKHMSGEFSVARSLRKQGPAKEAAMRRMEQDLLLNQNQIELLDQQNTRLSSEVKKLEAELERAVALQRETSQKLQEVVEREKAADKVSKEEKARDAAMQQEYLGFKDANTELRKQVERLQQEKAGVQQELSGAKKLLEKVKEENFALSDKNKALRAHVEKSDAGREVDAGASDRENKLRAELQKERASSAKWQSAFESLVKVVNFLLVKLRKEPLSIDKDKPEATVAAMEERNSAIRIKASPGAGLFQDSKTQTAEPFKPKVDPERKPNM
jgi:hypothetical protein